MASSTAVTLDRAIIVAAGRGQRMGELTEARPKCLLPVGGQPLFERALATLRRCGVRDISVVRGYRSDLMVHAGVRWFENPRYLETNIFASLWCAREAFAGGFIFLYSDIVVTEPVIRAALESTADLGVVVDRRWQPLYEGRHSHPVEQAELVAADATGHVKRIGKQRIVPPDEAYGEFIGVARVSARGVAALKAVGEQVFAPGSRGPVHQATSSDQTYFTDAVQLLVDAGHQVSAIPIDGGWQEIDTMQDYERAQERWAR